MQRLYFFFSICAIHYIDERSLKIFRVSNKFINNLFNYYINFNLFIILFITLTLYLNDLKKLLI